MAVNAVAVAAVTVVSNLLAIVAVLAFAFVTLVVFVFVAALARTARRFQQLLSMKASLLLRMRSAQAQQPPVLVAEVLNL